MSEEKPANPVKVLLVVGLIGVVGLVGMAGLLYAGWKLAGAPVLEDPGIETKELAGVIIKEEKQEGGPQNILQQQQEDIDEWFGSVDRQLAIAAGIEEARPMKQAEKKAWPKRPVVASSPIMADARTYQQWMARKDVLVMVVYYADW